MGVTSATLTIPPVQPNNVTSGTILIDATQVASDNYAAVSYTYPAQLVALSILPLLLTTQLITFNNPGTTGCWDANDHLGPSDIRPGGQLDILHYLGSYPLRNHGYLCLCRHTNYRGRAARR